MRDAYFRKTFSPENKKLPWLGYHVAPKICTLGPSHLVAVMRIRGVAHDTRELSALNNEFQRQNRCFQALGKQEGRDLMLQTYTFKRQVHLDAEYHLELPVLQDFADTYTAPFREGEFRQVGYAMSLILKYRDLEDGIARMTDLIQICTVMLDKFGVTVMGMEERNGQLFSEIARFFSLIVNGVDQDVLIGESRLGDAMIDSETGFGAYDYVENRPYSGQTRFATTYDLMDYPAKSEPGMWDEVIEEQSDFCLTQTFHFAERNKMKTKINIQRVDLANSEGESAQTDKLEEDIQAITQGSLVMGLYHASLVVFGDTPEKAVTKGDRLKSLLSAKSAVFKRSTSTNINTWLTQFPAYSDVIYRAPRSTENLACGFSLHATPGGKAKGNPMGDGSAMMPMMTVNGGLYFKNLQDSPEGRNSIGEKMPGHTFYMAMTGAGKTTAEAGDLLFLSRFNPQYFCIDYNHAMENLLRALGASYFSIVPNKYTGIQPFQWPDSDGLRQYLMDAVKLCVGTVDSDDEHLIKEGISAVMGHYVPAERSLSLLHQYIPDRAGGNALKARLARWCRKVRGREGEGVYAWVLDSPVNQFNPEGFRRLAFDCTPILKDTYVSAHGEVMVILMNTFFYMKDVMKSREPHSMLVTQISEVWACLMFDKTEKALREILSAGRMRGELLLCDTQNPEQMLATPAGPSFVQQIVTSIWMANEKADRESYAKFGVTGKQFDKVRELGKLSFQMMIKQGGKQTAVTLSKANSYTDAREQAINSRTDGLVADEASKRIAGDAETLKSANTHTDTLVGAEQQARIEGDRRTLQDATTYTDQRETFINNRTDSLMSDERSERIDGDRRTLNSANAYTNQRYDQLDNKVNRNERRANAGIAGAMAMSSIPYLNNYVDNSFGMAAGSYRGETAIASGYQRQINPYVNARVSMTWDTSQGVGVAAGMAVGW